MNNLKKLRLETKKTQEETAKDLKMPRTKYARYELGTAEPNIETLIKLADYYHTTIDYILEHNVPYLLDKSILSQEQQELIEVIQTLTPQNCKRVRDFITGILIAEEEKQNTIQNIFKKGE